MQFASLTSEERRPYLQKAAMDSGISPLILEKDFWVCWTLGRLFELPAAKGELLFKGGTSLSKVFKVIDRFSEDVDLGIKPVALGKSEDELLGAKTKTQRTRLHVALQEACGHHVQTRLFPLLDGAFRAVLGPNPSGHWIAYHLDARTKSPELRFSYPSISDASDPYIAKTVKLEFGSLTNQQPLQDQPVQAMLGEVLRLDFEDFTTRVTALGIERTFWEKATILHAEYHRPTERRMPDRYARHYSDFANLWQHPTGKQAANDLRMLAAVARHKALFFDSAWANYASAKQGSLRLSPPAERRQELRRDFETMRPMFLGTPPDFDSMLATIAAAERTINRS